MSRDWGGGGGGEGVGEGKWEEGKERRGNGEKFTKAKGNGKTCRKVGKDS